MQYFAGAVLLTAVSWKIGQTLAALGGKRWRLFAGSLLSGLAVYVFADAGKSFSGRIAVNNYDYMLVFIFVAAGLMILAACPEYCGEKRPAGKAGRKMVRGGFLAFCLFLAAVAAAMLALPGDGDRTVLKVVAVGQGIAVLAFADMFACKGKKIARLAARAGRVMDGILCGGGLVALLLAFLVPALAQMRGAVFEPLTIPSLEGLGITVSAMIVFLLCGYIWRRANIYRG